jgi:hypothetical protein
MPRKVADSIPPSTPTPIAFWLPEPAPLLMPAAARRGRRRSTSSGSDAGADARPAGSPRFSSTPCSCSSLANSTIRIAFFRRQADHGQQTTWKYTSFDRWNTTSPARCRSRPAAPPAAPRTAPTSFHTARPGTGTRSGSRSHTARGLRAGVALLGRQAGPLVADTRRQLGRHLFHFRHRGARAAARRRHAEDLGRWQAVVSLQARRRVDPASRSRRPRKAPSRRRRCAQTICPGLQASCANRAGPAYTLS